jgi:creatinine amidohydrolase/Fe(II)-dependent formamide hydrolase-like protein
MGRVARWLAFLLLLAAAICGPAQAATVFIEDLTWTELRDEIVAGKTTVIVPIGGTEQSGPHMALGKHNVRVKALAQKVALALGNALVAPVVAMSPEVRPSADRAHALSGNHHRARRTFERVLESAARSFRLHGFRDIVFIGDHGDYQKSLTAARDAAQSRVGGIRRPRPRHRRVLRGDQDLRARAQSRGYSDAEIGTHAGVADTSLTLAIDPALVRRDKLASSAANGSADGVTGDPRRSSAESGQLGVDAIVAAPSMRFVAHVRR